MVGERFSGPDLAYPCLQHYTTLEHTHEESRSCQPKSAMLLDFVYQVAGYIGKAKTAGFTPHRPHRFWQTDG